MPRLLRLPTAAASLLLLALLAPPPTAAEDVPPGGGWALVQVDDFDARPSDPNYVLSYGRGAIGWRWSLRNDAFAFQATWSDPPKVIAPSDRVRLTIGVSVTENSGSDYSASGSLHVFFDRPDVEPGSVGSPIGFANDAGESGGIDVVHRPGAPGSFRREVWVDADRLPRGADGGRIALVVSVYNGRIAGTRYVYEWKAPPPRPVVAGPPPPLPTPEGAGGETQDPAPGGTPSPSPDRASLTVAPSPLAADGESTAEAVFRLADEQGRPLAGVAVEWRLGPRLAPEELGALVRSDAATGADGVARALYRAPLLEARGMQEIGERKTRDVAVDYRHGERPGSRTAAIALLKTARVDVVIDKPGVVRSRVPVRLGSLNGRVEGRLQLRASHLPESPSETLEPLNDAAVSLEGPALDPAAAVGRAVSDEKGRFSIALKMTRWERFDLALKEPVVVEPDGEFEARRARLLYALGRWPASPEVGLRARTLVSEAPARLARLGSEEAEGLAHKLQIAAWMLGLLKDGRGDGRTAAGELLGHGWALLKAAGAHAWADSRLEKAVNDRVRHLEAAKPLRGLQAGKARLVKSLAGRSAARDRVVAWLSRVVLSRAPEAAEVEAAGRLGRSALDKLLLAKLMEALSEAAAEAATEGLPDAGRVVSEALLDPYDSLGNETVSLFLANGDYVRIRAASAGVEARLRERRAALARELERATRWRIGEDLAQSLLANASESAQAVLTVVAAGVGMPQLAAAAKRLDEVHKALDTLATSVRFAEECYRFSGILSRTSDAVLDATADAAGVGRRAARGPGAPGGGAPSSSEGLRLLPVVLAAEGPSFDLSGSLDWAPFAPREGRVSPGALGQLALAGSAVDEWWVAHLVPLLGVAESDPRGVAALLAHDAEWRASLREARAIGLESLEKPMSPAEQARWTDALATLRERTDALQGRLDAAARAAERLGPDPDAALRRSIAEAQRTATPAARGVARASGRPWLLLGASLAALLAGLAGLTLVLWRALGRRATATPAADVPPAEDATGQAPAFLVDARGRAHPIDGSCLSLGSAPDNAVVLASSAVSRHHARVWRTPEGACWIEDLGSTNGTRVDGQRVEKAWLRTGSSVSLGDETLRVS